MTLLTINHLPEEVYQAVVTRAAKHGQSLEAELLSIIVNAVLPEQPVKLGNLLEDIGKKVQLTDEEATYFARNDSLTAQF